MEKSRSKKGASISKEFALFKVRNSVPPRQRDYYLYEMVSGWSLAIDQATVLIWYYCSVFLSQNDNIFVIIIGIFLFWKIRKIRPNKLIKIECSFLQ